MGTYFKFTRMNGRDWWTDTVDYAGRLDTRIWLPGLPGGPCVTSRVYHVATVPEATMISSQWPGRLFEVQAEVASEHERVPGVVGVRTMFVLREVEAWQVFGPQGRDVVAVIDRLRGLTDAQLEPLFRHLPWSAGKFRAFDALSDHRDGIHRTAGFVAAQGAVHSPMADNAILAHMTRDRISDEVFEELLSPWTAFLATLD